MTLSSNTFRGAVGLIRRSSTSPHLWTSTLTASSGVFSDPEVKEMLSILTAIKHNAEVSLTYALREVATALANEFLALRLRYFSPRRISTSEPMKPHEFHASPLTTFLNRPVASEML